RTRVRKGDVAGVAAPVEPALPVELAVRVEAARVVGSDGRVVAHLRLAAAGAAPTLLAVRVGLAEPGRSRVARVADALEAAPVALLAVGVAHAGPGRGDRAIVTAAFDAAAPAGRALLGAGVGAARKREWSVEGDA